MATADLKYQIKVDDTALSSLITSTQKACDEIKDTWKESNHNLEEDYQNYIEAKKKLDSMSASDYEEYENAKTVVELSENDERLKSYIDYKNKEEEKNKQVIENTKKLAKTLTLSLTTPLVGLAGFGLKAASKIEDYTASFKTLLGTEPAAKKMIKTINDMAAATPFDPDPLIQSTEKLLAFGIEAENVNDVLNMLGDSSKGSAEALQTLSTAYGKVAAKGKASMEELNMMIDRGVPILGELAKVMGVTENEVIKLTSEGKVGFNEVNQAFKNMTSEGGVFYKGMETASQTLSGKLSTLKGNMTMLGAAVMEEVLPTVKSLVDAANNAVKAWSNMGNGAKTAILSVGTALATIGPALGVVTKAADTWKKLAPIIKTVVPAIKGATTAQLAWNTAQMANPIMLAVAGVAALTAGLAVLVARQKAAENGLNKIREAADKATSSAREYVNATKRVSEAATETDRKAAEIERRKAMAESVKQYEKLSETIEKIKKKDEKMRATEEEKKQLAEARVLREKMLIDIAEEELRVAGKNADVFHQLLMTTGDLSISYQQAKEIQEKAQKRITAELERQKKAEEDRIKAEQEAEKKRREAEENEKDGFVKAQEAYQKYIQNKEKLDSGFLDKTQKDTLDTEQKTLEENYNKYKAYLEKKKADEEKAAADREKLAKQQAIKELEDNAELIASLLNQRRELSDDSIDTSKITQEELISLAQRRAEIEQQLESAGADALKQYLIEQKAAGVELTEELQKVYDMFFDVEKKSKDTGDGIVSDAERIAAALSTVSSTVSAAASSIQTNFDALPGTLTKVNAAIASSVGKSGVAVFNALSNSVSAVVGNLKNWDENTKALKDAGWADDQAKGVQKVQMGLQIASSTLSAMGEVTGAVFDGILASIQDTIDQIDNDLNATLDGIKAKYEAQREDLQKSNDEQFGTQFQMGLLEKEKKDRLEMLKSEWAERGVILETGYETELEKAQEAYQNSIEAYQEALDEYTGLEQENETFRNEQLELYKQALEGKTDKELEEALKNKEIELEKSAMLDREEKKRTATEKMQEAERNRNQLAAEVEKQKIIDEANKKEQEAKVKAENERLRIEYESELETVKAENEADRKRHEAEESAFYATMASQIAQVWINAAAGTVAAWASCMPLGPIAGPIAASILTTALMSVAGVQTGTIASQSPPAAPTPAALPKEPAYLPVPGFATGVTAYSGGMALVGEEGPELVTLPQGSNVITNENTNDILRTLEDVLSGTGGDITVNVTCVIDGMEIPIKEQLIEIQRDEMYRSR